MGQYCTLQSGKIKYSELPDIIKGIGGRIIINKPKPEIKNTRTIDTDRLCTYFTPKFNGAQNHKNQFNELVQILQRDRNSNKDFARIATMLYDSENMSRKKPSTLSEWIQIFGECIEIKIHIYHRNKIDISELMKKEFSMII